MKRKRETEEKVDLQPDAKKRKMDVSLVKIIEVYPKDFEKYKPELFKVREIVFINEQKVTEEEEYDGKDINCIHLLLKKDSKAIATARLLPDGHIGRVCVLKEYRKLGVGKLLMEKLMEIAQKEGYKECILDAQLSALGFYEKLGFKAYGEVFLDAKIEHRHMKKIYKT